MIDTLLAGWHEIEHVSIMRVFLRSGVAGTPGLLAPAAFG